MKKQLLKKLYAYIATAMMFSVSANAQIIYTDIVPDSSCVRTGFFAYTYNLDLNGDGTTDFLIKGAHSRGRYPESPTTCYVSITPQGSNAFITTTLNTVKKLVPGDAISSSQAWHDTTLQNLKWYQSIFAFPPVITNTGEWDNVIDGYVGLQLINTGQTYYGWVRMDVTVSTSSVSMTIKDYAYNSIPNQPIVAGQTIATGINENAFASSTNLYPNPATNHFTIALPNANEKAKVTVTDINGKIIYATTANETHKLEVNTEDFAEGIYVVRIQTADFIGTKKLVVTK